ncbi:BPSL0067 family protein [Duganella violaceipulchra]|uniref:BPSL0067 family protein n=1 Tax=Duganella violaceipulchra TaxID=2849652 RepID=UPI001E53394A|nr:BPSL0067 family protein [Duganella violaceicalia]
MSYVYPKAAELKDEPVVGSHQCVALVQEYAGAPTTPHWRQGEAAVGNTTLRAGTAIATFEKGRYANRRHGNHAALYIRQGVNGIYVADQWKAPGKTKISVRLLTLAKTRRATSSIPAIMPMHSLLSSSAHEPPEKPRFRPPRSIGCQLCDSPHARGAVDLSCRAPRP